MIESCEKGLDHRSASNPTLAMTTSRVWHGQEVHAGQILSSENILLACPHCPVGGRQHGTRRFMASRVLTRRSQRPCAGVETPVARTGRSRMLPPGEERLEKASGRTSNMNAGGKTDGPIVPAKRANKAGAPVEERGSAKGNFLHHLLAPGTVPECARLRGGRRRLVEMVCLDR